MQKGKSGIKDRLTIATEYLKSIGCKEIILFGSLVDEDIDEFSDIDLAVSGISPRTYFKTLVEISSVVGGKVDLVTMDYISQDFKDKIRRDGKRIYAR